MDQVAVLLVALLVVNAAHAAAGSEVEEFVSGLAGQDVSLPCSVDVNACGEFHSIKWYRDGQRVFLFSELANLDRGEGVLANRSRFVYSSDKRLAGLKISSLELSDEAVYRCDITYLQINDGCPVVQFVNLTVLGNLKKFLKF